MRKGCIDETLVDKALGHRIDGAGDAIVDFLLALDPVASRYVEATTAELPIRSRHWSVECRYIATASPGFDGSVLRDLINEARSFVDGCLLSLWCDGAITTQDVK